MVLDSLQMDQVRNSVIAMIGIGAKLEHLHWLQLTLQL